MIEAAEERKRDDDSVVGSKEKGADEVFSVMKNGHPAHPTRQK